MQNLEFSHEPDKFLDVINLTFTNAKDLLIPDMFFSSLRSIKR